MHKSNEDLLKLFKKVQKKEKKELVSIFERHGVDPSEGVETLVNEISLDGANTIASIFRGWKGIAYHELVEDVAKKLKVDLDGSDSLEDRDIEIAILSDVLSRSLENLSSGEKEEINVMLQEFQKGKNIQTATKISSLTAAGLTLLFQKVEGKLVINIIRGILNVTLRRGATGFAGAVGAAGVTGLIMPLLSIGMLGSALIRIAGPAYRKIIPTVLEIALLRLRYGKKS